MASRRAYGYVLKKRCEEIIVVTKILIVTYRGPNDMSSACYKTRNYMNENHKMNVFMANYHSNCC